MVDKIIDNLDVSFSVTRINECFSVSMAYESFGVVELIPKKSKAGIRFSLRAIIQICSSEDRSAGDCSYTFINVSRETR